MKCCYLFSGQGAQKVGYLDDCFAKYNEFLENIRLAEKLTDYPLELVFRYGPQEKLNQTIYTQLFLFIYGYTLAKILERETNIRPSYLAGLSIGEYTALCYANVFSFEDGIKLVFDRATLMHKACVSKNGTMFAMIGATFESAKRLCESLAQEGIIAIANYNAQNQIVIGCEERLRDKVVNGYKNFGVKRVVELKVEGAFHTPLMDYAAQNLSFYIDNTPFQNAQIPVVSNTTATVEVEAANIKENLKKQIITPVLWYDSMLYLKEQNVKNFIELGPAGVLSDLVKKTIPDALVYKVDNKQDIENIINILKV